MSTTIAPAAKRHGLPPGPRVDGGRTWHLERYAAHRVHEVQFPTAQIGFALAYLFVFLGLPLYVVFQEALRKGFAAYFTALREPELLHALRLTLLVAGIAVPLNVVFGIAAAWAITKGRVRWIAASVRVIRVQ